MERQPPPWLATEIGRPRAHLKNKQPINTKVSHLFSLAVSALYSRLVIGKVMSSVESAVRGADYTLKRERERAGALGKAMEKRERAGALGWCGVGRVLVDDA